MRGAAIAFAFLAACGGRILVNDGETGQDGGMESSTGDDSTTTTGPRCTSGSVRLCGGTCGEVSDCPGSGCTPLFHGDGSASAIGVCWTDLADKGDTPCALCDDNQGCVQRATGEYVCVPLDVCAAVASQVARDVCWYGDKVPYDGRPEATSTSCPGPTGVTCGGSCAPCASYTLPRCVGRGPGHPIGICPVLAGTVQSTDPNQFPRCSMTASGYSVACPILGGYPFACVVYPSPPAEEAVAMLNGYCMSVDDCMMIAQTLPGGLDCYDATGAKLTP